MNRTGPHRAFSARLLVTAAALGAAVALAGCNAENIALSNSKANIPVPQKLLAEMEKKNMDPQSPMLVRIFKQEAELEVWKQDRNGQFALLQSYPICRWSGDLGPKIREGDRQAPEGFYSITPAQMNPRSQYFLSFNTGYPNAFDKALGRTGSELMVHGDCSSRGCYAMTDEQIAEIYALGRESFFGGQRAFQLQAYPFKMTAQNLAKHRNNPHMPFWKMIKQGSDHFEVTRQEPKVDVCEKRYVFNAQAPAGSTRPLNFSPAGACPTYEVAEDVTQSVREKQAKDDAAVSQLVSRGTPVARMNTGIDGGMHTVFASKLPNGNTGLSDNENKPLSMVAYASTPGTIPPHVNPPKEPGQAASASAASSQAATGFTLDFLRPSTPAPAATATTPSRPSTAVATVRPAPPAKQSTPAPTSVVRVPDARPAEATRTAAAQPAKPATTTSQTAAAAAPQGQNGAMTGSAPVVQGNSFSSRWGAFQ